MATITGTDGDDTLVGTAFADVIYGYSGNDILSGGNGNDVIYGGAGDDIHLGGSADNGTDQVYLEEGNDTAFLGFISAGTEIIDGGDGIDTANFTSFPTLAVNADLREDGSIDFLGSISSRNVWRNFENLVGNDAANNFSGNSGVNVIEGGGGNDTINGEGGDDTLDGGTGNDTVRGGDGNDVITGGDGSDQLFGDAGNDTIFAGNGNDNVDGGTGSDEIHGGGDNDNLSGGDDADTIIIDSLGTAGINNTTVNGGSGGDDNDTLDISWLINEGWEVTNLVQNPETNGNPGFNGQIQLFNSTTGQFANINYNDIENFVGVVCFTPGTLIATPKGEVPVERLRVGDRVITRDNGIQEIRWIGRKDIRFRDLANADHLKPVLIRAGALGNGLPERDMMLSPNHRVLVANDQTALYFDEREVLAAAKHLVGNQGVQIVEPIGVSYIHFMFDNHEVVLSDGAWTESFQPGDYALKGIGNAQRQELFELFPELETREGLEGYAAARRILKKHEARMLFKG